MIRTILSGLIIFAVIWFTVTNASLININAFFWNVSISTALVVFVAFMLGFVFGVIRVAPAWFRKHSLMKKSVRTAGLKTEESKELAQRVRELEAELAAAREKCSCANGRDSQMVE